MLMKKLPIDCEDDGLNVNFPDEKVVKIPALLRVTSVVTLSPSGSEI